jgi:hypothetical protein
MTSAYSGTRAIGKACAHSITTASSNALRSNPRPRKTEERIAMPRKKELTMLTHDGVTLPLIEWAKRTGQSDTCLRARIRLGWPIADALYRPRNSRGQLSVREKRQAERLNVAFNKLVHEVDYALRTFQRRRSNA